MDASLLGLPWQIQFSLASGYAAYALAYIGIRSHHQTIDVAFRTLVFSAIATLVLNLSLPGGGPILAPGAALLASLVASLIWRAWGRSWVREGLSHSGYAVVDDDPTAFSRVYADTKHQVTQLIVTLTDGAELHCDDTSAFRNAAIAPFVMGNDGSIAMYVTRCCTPKQGGGYEEEEYTSVRDKDWGDRITLIRADQVRRVEVRFRKKS